MRFDLTVYLFAWVLLMLLALLFCRFWQGGKRAPAVPKPPNQSANPSRLPVSRASPSARYVSKE